MLIDSQITVHVNGIFKILDLLAALEHAAHAAREGGVLLLGHAHLLGQGLAAAAALAVLGLIGVVLRLGRVVHVEAGHAGAGLAQERHEDLAPERHVGQRVPQRSQDLNKQQEEYEEDVLLGNGDAEHDDEHGQVEGCGVSSGDGPHLCAL